MRVDLAYLRCLLRRGAYRRTVVMASISGGWLHTREYAIRRGARISGTGFACPAPI